ncbi:hypothetical protein [Acinetobacter thermotolerans]|uniref:hypothetical protein n=1 Tax=Acinetobacter thermotolerans TaxID=3151487 RepID=UPI00325B7774
MMRVEIIGLERGSFEVELEILPREGEYLKFVDEAGAEVEAEIAAITHYIYTSTQEQQIKIELRPKN